MQFFLGKGAANWRGQNNAAAEAKHYDLHRDGVLVRQGHLGGASKIREFQIHPNSSRPACDAPKNQNRHAQIRTPEALFYELRTGKNPIRVGLELAGKRLHIKSLCCAAATPNQIIFL